MNQKDALLKQYTFYGMITTFALAMIFHLIYQWSDNHLLIGLLTPINNSLWEYLKLLFIPMTIYFISEYQIIGLQYPNLIPARIYGMTFGLAIMLLCYCTYYAILGRRFLLLDLFFFILGTCLSFWCSQWIQLKRRLNPDTCKRSMLLLGFLIICFIGFSLVQPRLGLFATYERIPR